MKYAFLIALGSLAAIAAGLIHIFIVAVGHGDIVPHFIAFVLGGVLQIVLGIFMWFDAFVKHTFWAKSIVHGGFIFMLIFSLFLPIPFMGSSEHLGSIGLITIVLQFLAILCLVPSVIAQEKLSILKTLGSSFAFAFISGSLVFALGYWGEHMFPELKGERYSHGGHHHGAVEKVLETGKSEVLEVDELKNEGHKDGHTRHGH